MVYDVTVIITFNVYENPNLKTGENSTPDIVQYSSGNQRNGNEP